MNPGKWEPDGGPLDEPTTFLSHALALSALHGPGPWPDGGGPLPDERPRPDGEDGPRLTSLVLDGVRTHGFGVNPEPVAARELADLLETAASAPLSTEPLARLHDTLAGQSALDLVDVLLKDLRGRGLPQHALHEVARHLVEHGSARDTVKLGIALLGECGGEDDRDLLLLLGALEEFTLYAVVALVKTQPDRQRAAYELARRVQGWGRIHAVERLRGCGDPEIKAWLLRDGFRNDIMNEYLAHLAATTGDLYSALLEPDVDDALLEGAGDILNALARGGPSKDVTHYDEAVPTMHRYAELVSMARPTVVMLDHLLTIRRRVLKRNSGVAWPEGEPEGLIRRYDALLARPVWREVTLTCLNDPSRTPHPYGFNIALSCAGRMKMPVMPAVLRHLEQNPPDEYAWQWAVQHSDSRTITSVLTLAARLLPLDTLTSGPANGTWFGPDRAPDRVLWTIVDGLSEHPGVGLDLLRASLSSRVTNVRNSACKTLTGWPPESRPSRLRDWISVAAAAEPDERLRDAMLAFLEPPTPPAP
ncbi:hypothetical protein AB0L06_17905 [Spirillospora sp. NPDC052269]